MISFPDDLVSLKNLDGYFWDMRAKKLFSIKVAGILKELKCFTANHWFKKAPKGAKYYVLSVQGKKKYLFVDKIEKLIIDPSTIKVQYR